MQKPCHNHEEISQPHSPARCTPARDSASSSAGLPGGMASWALPWLLAASEPFGPDAMTPAEGMSQVNKMVSLSLSIAISKMVCPTHLYVYQHEMQQKTGFTYVRVLGRAFVSLRRLGQWGQTTYSEKVHVCVWNVSICRTVDDCLDSVHSCFHEAVVAPS